MKNLINRLKSFLFENHTTTQIVIKNSFWLTLGEVLIKITNFFIFIILARKLTLNEYGDLNYINSYISLFLIFADFGLNTILFKDVSGEGIEKNKNKLYEILKLKGILSTIVIGVIILLNYLSKNQIDTGLLLIGSIYIVSKNFYEIFKILYRSINRFEKEFSLKLIEVFFNIVCIFVFLFSTKIDLYYILGLFMIGNIFILIAYYINNQNHFNLKFKDIFKQKIKIEYLKLGFYYGGAGFLATINFYFDQFWLGMMGMKEQLGIYGGLYRIIGILIMSTAYVFVPIFPILSAKFSNRQYLSIKKIILNLSKRIILFSAISLPLVYFLKSYIIQYSLGSEFLIGGNGLVLLYIIFLIIFIKEPFGYTIVAMGKQRIVFWTLLFSAIVNIIGNIIFIKHYGYMGAAYVTLVSETINTLIMTVYCFKYLNTKINE